MQHLMQIISRKGSVVAPILGEVIAKGNVLEHLAALMTCSVCAAEVLWSVKVEALAWEHPGYS